MCLFHLIKDKAISKERKGKYEWKLVQMREWPFRELFSFNTAFYSKLKIIKYYLTYLGSM